MRLAAVAVLVTVTIAMASPARADERPSRGYVGGGIGGAGGVGGQGGAVLDAIGYARFGLLAIGADLQAGTVAFFGGYTSAEGAVGVFAPTSRSLEVGLLGTAGVHSYSGVGREILSDDPGMSATLPAAGVRAVVGGTFGSREAARFCLGFHFFADADLQRSTKSYSYLERDRSLFSSDPTSSSTEFATHTAGMARIGVLLALGASF